MVEVSMLKEMETLHGLTDEALAFLAESFQKRTYGDGEPIFKDGVPGGDLYLVAEGAVRISKKAKEGESQNLASVSAGRFFGVMTFLAGGNHNADASAQGACTLLVLDRKAFDRLVDEHPGDAVRLMNFFVGELVDSLRAMNERYIDMVNYMWRWR